MEKNEKLEPASAWGRAIDENSDNIRKLVKDYIWARKRGENKSKINDKADLLTLFLEIE